MDILRILGISSRELWHALSLSGLLVGIILLLLAINTFWIEPWKKRRKVSKRLEEASHKHLQQIKLLKEKLEGRSDRIAAVLGVFPQKKISELQSQLLKADIFWDPLSFLGLTFFLGVVGIFLGIFGVQSTLSAVLLGGGLGSIPYWYLTRKKKRKALQFEALMPDAMELLARSLRAGHTLPSAIELLSSEVGAPVGTEMLIAFEEQRFGISMADSLVNMVQRVDSQDLKYFVTAVLIQQETGGNLVELVEKIGHLIRSRLNFKIKIRALTADGRLSANVLSVLPVFMFFLLLLIKPEYESLMITTPLGRKILMVGAVVLLLGILMLNKLVKSVEA